LLQNEISVTFCNKNEIRSRASFAEMAESRWWSEDKRIDLLIDRGKASFSQKKIFFSLFLHFWGLSSCKEALESFMF